MKYKEVVLKLQPYATREDMMKLNEMTDCFVEKVRKMDAEFAEEFVESIHNEFSYFLDYETAKMAVDKMKNEDPHNPSGQKWDKETTLKVFSDAGHPTSSDKYSENGVYWAMNMVYSDYYPMHHDDVAQYVEQAFLFLNDKDYCGRYSKEKWFAKKMLDY